MSAEVFTHCQRPGCGKAKTLPKLPAKRPGSTKGKTGSSSYVDPRIYETEPYCSRVCLELDLGLRTEEEEPPVEPVRRGARGTPPPHGTELRYGYYRCRCSECRKGASAARKRRREAGGNLTTSDNTG